MRQRNPETIFAAWASSAPVHAQVDMASYYKAAERSLTRNCSADWVAVTRCGHLNSNQLSIYLNILDQLRRRCIAGIERDITDRR